MAEYVQIGLYIFCASALIFTGQTNALDMKGGRDKAF